MFGKNKIMKQDLNPDSFWVQEIFYTIQGEGPFSGRPAIFIRLAGCNLRCHFCDTDFESSTQHLTAKEIVNICLLYPANLIVITGGEPFRQNLYELCLGLLSCDYSIQIETAGTLWQEELDSIADKFHIVCSPKTGSIHSSIEKYCKDWKYITKVGDVDLTDGLPNKSTQIEGKSLKLFRPSEGTIWLQPMMEYLLNGEVDTDKTYANTVLAAELVMKHGYRLTIQMHKLIGLP